MFAIAICSAVSLFVFVTSLSAQTVSKAGEISFFEMGNFKRLRVGDVELPLRSQAMAAEVVEQRGNLFLIAEYTGGNGCIVFYSWLHAVPGKVSLSSGFGNCLPYSEIFHDEETVTVIVPAKKNWRGQNRICL